MQMTKKSSLVLVFLAGATGAILRYAITAVFFGKLVDETFTTLGVNLVAGLIAGFVVTIGANGLVSNFLKKYETVVVSGFLGGFSTVAAVSWLNYKLVFTDGLVVYGAVFLLCNYFGAFAFGKLGEFLANCLNQRLGVAHD
jgi:fluoride ion exporter CrcB/FEX